MKEKRINAHLHQKRIWRELAETGDFKKWVTTEAKWMQNSELAGGIRISYCYACAVKKLTGVCPLQPETECGFSTEGCLYGYYKEWSESRSASQRKLIAKKILALKWHGRKLFTIEELSI